MSDLTTRFVAYRQCLRYVWNTYLAKTGDWDDRVYFSNAALELLRCIVMFDFQDRDQPLLPAHRGDQCPVLSIRVTPNAPWEKVRISADRAFADVREVSIGELDTVELAYVDLWDFYALGTREFKFVCAEVVVGGAELKVGERLLVPFDAVEFTNRNLGVEHTNDLGV